MNISVVVQHGGDFDPFRRACASAIRQHFPHATIARDPDRKGSLWSFVAAMRQYRDADWHLIVQDDVAWIPDDPQKVVADVAAAAQDGIVTLFVPRREVATIPYGGIAKINGVWGQANLFHRDVVNPFLDWVTPRRWLHTYRVGDDTAVSAWANDNGVPIRTINPSLVEHVGDKQSIEGNRSIHARTTRTTWQGDPETWHLGDAGLPIGTTLMKDLETAVAKRRGRANA